VRLGEDHLERLPNQLSGGERQRVAIARAFAAEPTLLLCDEVTSALDVSVQAVVLEVLLRLQADRQTTLIFVSHDLAVVRAISHRVGILYAGQLCEIGPTEQIFAPPLHPYTATLLSAAAGPDAGDGTQKNGDAVPPTGAAPVGCCFAARCQLRLHGVCDREAPPWQTVGQGHAIRCHLPFSELNRIPATYSQPSMALERKASGTR
jgi:peptide/nickel transport system ATP-binding protein